MIERNTKGYYRSKVKDCALYDQMTAEYERFIKPKDGCQISGFATFWSTYYIMLGFYINPYLLSILQARYRIEIKKNARSGTIKCKMKRSAHKYDKYNNALKKQHDDHKQG